MYLNDRLIHQYVTERNMIKPFNLEQLQSASYDCKLLDTIWDPVSQQYYNLNDRPCIEPDEFLIASTVEEVNIPPSLICEVWGKSSNARKGLQIHTTAGWVDPGFQGQITLELKNNGPFPIDLRELKGICQLTFAQLAKTAFRPYDGHYQMQEGPTKAYF